VPAWRTPAVGSWTDVPGRFTPRSVRACESAPGALLLYRRGEEGRGRLVAAPIRCRSWRCRRCGWSVARDTYKRVEVAACSRDLWAYTVLTFDPRRGGTPWDAYREAGDLWDHRLRRSIEREHGRVEYVQTWERHARGWPHVNLLVGGEGVRAALRAARCERRWAPKGAHGRGRWATWTAWRRWLRPVAERAGFGRVLWCELVGTEHLRGLAAYLAKVCHDLSQASLKRGDQTPIGAPLHFRRVRASRGLLPPPPRYSVLHELDEDTGELTYRLQARAPGTPGEWTGILSARPASDFDARAPSWSIDYVEALDYAERRRQAVRRLKG